MSGEIQLNTARLRSTVMNSLILMRTSKQSERPLVDFIFSDLDEPKDCFTDALV